MLFSVNTNAGRRHPNTAGLELIGIEMKGSQHIIEAYQCHQVHNLIYFKSVGILAKSTNA